MKQLFTTALFLFVVQFGWSQIEMKLKPRISIQDTDSVIVSADGIRIKRPPFFISNSALPNSDSSRFSHSVTAGSVYTSAQDNMPCLKPNTTLVYNMPVPKASGNDNMPNAYQQPKNELLQSLRKQFQKDKK